MNMSLAEQRVLLSMMGELPSSFVISDDFLN